MPVQKEAVNLFNAPRIYIYIYIYRCIPLSTSRIRHKVNFKGSKAGLNFVFLHLDVLPYYGLRNSVCHLWRGNSCMFNFPKEISVMRNVNSLVYDLNSWHRVHFLRRYPSHHLRLLKEKRYVRRRERVVVVRPMLYLILPDLCFFFFRFFVLNIESLLKLW